MRNQTEVHNQNIKWRIYLPNQRKSFIFWWLWLTSWLPHTYQQTNINTLIQFFNKKNLISINHTKRSGNSLFILCCVCQLLNLKRWSVFLIELFIKRIKKWNEPIKQKKGFMHFRTEYEFIYLSRGYVNINKHEVSVRTSTNNQTSIKFRWFQYVLRCVRKRHTIQITNLWRK